MINLHINKIPKIERVCGSFYVFVKFGIKFSLSVIYLDKAITEQFKPSLETRNNLVNVYPVSEFQDYLLL